MGKLPDINRRWRDSLLLWITSWICLALGIASELLFPTGQPFGGTTPPIALLFFGGTATILVIWAAIRRGWWWLLLVPIQLVVWFVIVMVFSIKFGPTH